MAESGIIDPDERVELIVGEIISMSPMSSRHAATVRKIAGFFQRILSEKSIVSVQMPIRLDDQSEPEPDVALLRVVANQYADAHPGPADVRLIVEVAQSSLDFDREVKIPLYARSGIVETWLVDLEAQQVEIFREPGPSGYADHSRSGRAASIAPQAFPEAAVKVGDLLA